MDADSCWKAHEPTGRAGSAVLVRLPLLVALGLAALLIPYVTAHFVGTALNNLSEGRHGWLLALAPGFLGLYMLLGGLRWSAILVFSYLGFSHSTCPRRANLSEWPRVSILVPCYNEEATVEPMMHSLLNLDYPDFEILVVDDGSTDKTYEKARHFAGHYEHCRVRVYRKLLATASSTSRQPSLTPPARAQCSRYSTSATGGTVEACRVSMHRDNLKLLAFVPLYDFYQGLLLNNALIVAAFDQIRGKAMRW